MNSLTKSIQKMKCLNLNESIAKKQKAPSSKCNQKLNSKNLKLIKLKWKNKNLMKKIKLLMKLSNSTLENSPKKLNPIMNLPSNTKALKMHTLSQLNNSKLLKINWLKN